MCCTIWYHLYDLKKNVKSNNFTNTPPLVFSRFLNCTNGTKLWNASHMDQEESISGYINLIFCACRIYAQFH